MTEKEFTTKVLAHLEDIRALYKKFNPVEFEIGHPYLSMSILDNTIMFWNCPDGENRKKCITEIPNVHFYKSGYPM